MKLRIIFAFSLLLITQSIFSMDESSRKRVCILKSKCDKTDCPYFECSEAGCRHQTDGAFVPKEFNQHDIRAFVKNHYKVLDTPNQFKIRIINNSKAWIVNLVQFAFKRIRK